MIGQAHSAAALTKIPIQETQLQSGNKFSLRYVPESWKILSNAEKRSLEVIYWCVQRAVLEALGGKNQSVHSIFIDDMSVPAFSFISNQEGQSPQRVSMDTSNNVFGKNRQTEPSHINLQLDA